VLLPNSGLGSGASGSMVIDRWGMVVGTYWGVFTNQNQALVDILINDEYYNVIASNNYV
jgi:hypothetical protein